MSFSVPPFAELLGFGGDILLHVNDCVFALVSSHLGFRCFVILGVDMFCICWVNIPFLIFCFYF